MKLGTTSWLFPGTYLENVKVIADKVDFVEFLVFSWDTNTKNIFLNEIEDLKEIAEEFNLEYNVHLPTDCIFNVEKAFCFFENSRLEISNYIVHPLDGIEVFLKKSEKILVENLKEDIFLHDRTVFDIGHHLLGTKVTENFLKNSIEYHVMGVSNGKDHLKLDKDTLEVVKKKLKYSPNLEYVCFEVFDLRDFLHSLTLWRDSFDL
ncbi:xylose isomerase [Thermosipho affectus]|uniref:Xylose isomerase n=1 Tax=Thermosipho affectus TaxID=660294 RepID=A0ABX3IH41_9BACT|nr:cobamide remodeling phosphodiesterase CbiR [Thermosipho affectus]ONN27152.1 xylose isomerase [Thermosipho affectus]